MSALERTVLRRSTHLLVRTSRCQTFHATSAVSLPNLVAFTMLRTILDAAEGYDAREIRNVAHRLTIEAPAGADAQLTLIVLKNKARLETSILDSSSNPVAQQALCTYTDYLKKHKTLGQVFKSSHYRQSPQGYILHWALVTPEPHITTLAMRDNLNVVRATDADTR